MTWGVRGLTVRLGGRPVLDGVSLDVPLGAVTCVVGGDGVGKTTLMRVLVGALRPGAGEVRRPDARRIGYLASTSGTYPDLSVDENLAFAASAYGVPAAEIPTRTRGYLERTHLAAAHDRLVGELSGGMRQKLGVIRAMVHRPELLVLDEPTTGVDPVSRADLWWLIARAASDGAAVVLSTTYLDEAERASFVLVLDDGRALLDGTPNEIAAAVPGVARSVIAKPEGEVGRRAWRRGAGWRVWEPNGTAEHDAPPPDLRDSVMIAALARRLEGAGR